MLPCGEPLPHIGPCTRVLIQIVPWYQNFRAMAASAMRRIGVRGGGCRDGPQLALPFCCSPQGYPSGVLLPALRLGSL